MRTGISLTAMRPAEAWLTFRTPVVHNHDRVASRRGVADIPHARPA
jgi:hypothetical protein